MTELIKIIVASILVVVTVFSVAFLFEERGRRLTTEIFQLTCEERGVVTLNEKRYECRLIEQEIKK